MLAKNYYLLMLYVVITNFDFNDAENICNSNKLLYQEMGCSSLNGELENGCHQYYNCDKFFARNRDYCYFNDKQYKLSETLTESYYRNHNPCLVDCYCSIYKPDEPKFICTMVECEEEAPAACYLKYNTTSCCPDVYCPPTDQLQKQCQYKDRKVAYGEKFYEESMSCVCDEEFNGNLSSKSCRPIVCNYEILYSNNLFKGCLPIYFGKLNGCAIYWRCYNSSIDSVDIVVRPGYEVKIGGKIMYSTLKQPLSSDLSHKCKFGNMTLNIHDKLLANNDGSAELCVECVCNIPPLLTCFRDTACEEILPTDIRVHGAISWLLNSSNITMIANVLLYLMIISNLLYEF